MPQIAYLDSLPCPSALQLTPAETRLSSDPAGRGPVELRSIEQDERTTQRLQFVYNAAQTQAFVTWWRDVLVYGGAWFSAPGNWPAIEGSGTVKVRRFISAPQFASLGMGFTRVTIDCEARGRTVLPFSEDPDVGTDVGILVVASPVHMAVYAASWPGVQVLPLDWEEFGTGGSLEGGAGVLTVDNTSMRNSSSFYVGDEDAYWVVEYLIQDVGGARVMVGLYPTGGPPPNNFDAFGFGQADGGILNGYASDGTICSYGSLMTGYPTFTVGDRIGVVTDFFSSTVTFYKNGVPIETTGTFNNQSLYIVGTRGFNTAP